MTTFRLEPTARDSLDEINDYTARRWGDDQAATYINRLFAEIERIAARTVPWRPLAVGFKLKGYSRRCEKHVIYWFVDDNQLCIFAILHESMDQLVRAHVAFDAATKA